MIYPETSIKINLEFTRKFMQMQHRGTFHSEIFIEKMLDPPTVNPVNANLSAIQLANYNSIRRRQGQLTKGQIYSYKKMCFLYGVHSECTNNKCGEFIQPIGDILGPRLICDGNIYNAPEESSLDIEYILDLYNANKGDIKETCQQLEGAFAFIITENLSTTNDITKLNVIVARDILGIKPLYYTYNTDMDVHLFSSEIESIPDIFFKNYKTIEFPKGHYWDYQSKQMIPFVESVTSTRDFVFDNDVQYIYNQATPDTLVKLYKELHIIITSAVSKRIKKTIEPFGVLYNNIFSDVLLIHVLDSLNIPFHIFSGIEAIDTIKEMVDNLSNSSLITVHAINVQSKEEVYKYIQDFTNVRLILSSKYLFDYNYAFKEDAIAIKHSINQIYPYLDKNLIKLHGEIHPDLKLPQIYDNSKPKIAQYIIRMAFKDIINKKYLWKPTG